MRLTRLWPRVGIFGFGTLIAYEGMALLKRGIFAYRNHYHAEVYSPALTVMGVLLMILALIPDSLVERLVRRGRHKDKMPRSVRHFEQVQ